MSTIGKVISRMNDQLSDNTRNERRHNNKKKEGREVETLTRESQARNKERKTCKKTKKKRKKEGTLSSSKMDA